MTETPPWVCVHILLQQEIFEAYVHGSEPIRSARTQIHEVHQRIKKLNDWLFIELLLLTDPENQSLLEIAQKFRTEEEAGPTVEKGEPESPAPASPLTN